METPTHRNTNNHRDLDRSLHGRPHARYPSLYEDFEPFFGRKRGKPRRASTIAATTVGRHPPRSHLVRLFALLAIVALIAALAVSG